MSDDGEPVLSANTLRLQAKLWQIKANGHAPYDRPEQSHLPRPPEDACVDCHGSGVIEGEWCACDAGWARQREDERF